MLYIFIYRLNIDQGIDRVDIYIDHFVDVAGLLEVRIEDIQECQHICDPIYKSPT